MKRRIIAHPPGLVSLLNGHGRGGPTVPGGTPAHPAIPPAPSLPNPTSGATKAISDALGSAVQKFVQDILPPAEVLLGAVLVVVGLLFATGQMGKVGKAGVFVATRGVIK